MTFHTYLLMLENESENDMFCQNCGQQLLDDSIFCKHCGKKVDMKSNSVVPNSSLAQSDFVTLNCPSCGGKLKIQQNTETLVCHYCGSEHMVRRNNSGVFLERFARCPTCGRNDKSRKATLMFGFPPKPTFESLYSPPEWGKLIFVTICILAFPVILIIFGETKGLMFSIILFLFWFFTMVWAVNKNSKLVNSNPKIIDRNLRIEESYKSSLEIWDKVYYCERDDTFFSIDESQIVTRKTINEYFPFWTLNSNFLDEG